MISTKEAAAMANMTDSGVRKIIERNIEKHPNLAKKIGRDWVIDKELFEKLFISKLKNDI